MAIKGCYVLMLLAAAVNLLCGVDDVSASRTKQMCDYGLASADLDFMEAFNSHNRTQYRERCVEYQKLGLECNMTKSEAYYYNEYYDKFCKAKDMQEWLASSGSARFSSWILSTLALLLTILC